MVSRTKKHPVRGNTMALGLSDGIIRFGPEVEGEAVPPMTGRVPKNPRKMTFWGVFWVSLQQNLENRLPAISWGPGFPFYVQVSRKSSAKSFLFFSPPCCGRSTEDTEIFQASIRPECPSPCKISSGSVQLSGSYFRKTRQYPWFRFRFRFRFIIYYPSYNGNICRSLLLRPRHIMKNTLIDILGSWQALITVRSAASLAY